MHHVEKMQQPDPKYLPKKRWAHRSGARFFLAILGVVLMAISPIIGALPGPGFIILFPIGLALTLQNSRFAKKRYVDFKRRFPQYGKWTDWAMRRRRHDRLPDDFSLPLIGKVRTRDKG